MELGLAPHTRGLGIKGSVMPFSNTSFSNLRRLSCSLDTVVDRPTKKKRKKNTVPQRPYLKAAAASFSFFFPICSTEMLQKSKISPRSLGQNLVNGRPEKTFREALRGERDQGWRWFA